MTHAQANLLIASLTDEAFCIQSHSWRYAGETSPTITYRVSISPKGGECQSFERRTLAEATGMMVDFLSPKNSATGLDAIDESLATVSA